MRRRGQEREHRPSPELITGLAARVADGQIRLPKFQREFVWSRQQVLDLLDSIARNYPIGSFLLWNSDSIALASDASIAGLPIAPPEHGDDTTYLLDGCQRLSTICGALYWTPDGDPDSYWNLVYDLEQERFAYLWTTTQYRRGSAPTKALALMLATAGPRDLRTGNRIDTGTALAMANEMQFHHFFPVKWLLRQGTSRESANMLANIVLLTAISNQVVSDRAPSAYLNYEMDVCGKDEMAKRVATSLVSERAFEAALSDNYQEFVAARAEMLLGLAEELSRGSRMPEVPASDDPEIIEHALSVEIMDNDTADDGTS